MKNRNQEGRTVTMVAPSGGVVAGVGYVIGAIFVVATETKAQGLEFEGARMGAIELKKLSTDNITQGARLAWNNTNKEVQLTGAVGTFWIGAAVEAKGAVAGNVLVALDAQAVVAN